MLKKFSVLMVAALLVGSLAGANPAAAQSLPGSNAAGMALPAMGTGQVMAKKKLAPKIIVGKTKKTTVKKPFPLVTTLRTPALQGSTAKNRSLFKAQVNGLIAAEKNYLKKWRASSESDCRIPSNMGTSSISTSIHKGRYASVTMVFASDACERRQTLVPRSFTLDLATGKKVGLGTFMDFKSFGMRMVTTANLLEIESPCPVTREIDPYRTKGYDALQQPDAWNVSSKGIRIWYRDGSLAANACGPTSRLLPWKEVATAKAMGGATKTKIYVTGYKYNPKTKATKGHAFIMTTRGRKIAVLDTTLDTFHGMCLTGVRSGKTATLVTPVVDKFSLKLAGTTSNPALPKIWVDGYKVATKAQSKIVLNRIKEKSAITACG